MALECTLSSLLALDRTDPVAVQQLLNACTHTLFSAELWGWLLGITVVCVAVGMLIGWAKGRVWTGFWWSLALGPIGWVIVALSKAKLPECPECGLPNRLGAKVCRHCGVNFDKLARQTARSGLKAVDRHRGW